MRIALIRPGLGSLGGRRYRSKACLEPTSLAILAGLTPPDVEVSAFDDRFEEMPFNQSWDLVALSVGTFEARRAYEIADSFRERGVQVVLGGFHPTFCPDEASAHADAVALGEAEGLWPAIVEDARTKALKRCYEHQQIPNIGGFIPNHAVFAKKRYASLGIVQFGRGCKYNCDFCCIKAFYNTGLRQRPVDEVVTEIERSGRKMIFFVDDNLVANPEAAKQLLRAIVPLKIHWITQTSLDFVDDKELLSLMVKSGCQSVILGLESLNNKNMRQMGKGWSKTGEYQTKLEIIRKAGIMIYATFVFGYDDDGPDVFQRTLDFAMQQKFFLVNFNHLQPYPGTRLYERLRKEGRLVYQKWWLDPAYRFGEAVFHPRGMTVDQLTEGSYWARSSFHSWSGIGRRLLDVKANMRNPRNLVVFLATNIASRQDIRRKQGLKLGMNGAKEGSNS